MKKIVVTLDLAKETTASGRTAFNKAMKDAGFYKADTVTTLWVAVEVFASATAAKKAVIEAGAAAGVVIQKAYVFTYSDCQVIK